MAPKKLTEADKKSILELYREPEETTSTLAARYGVSNSTISRLLKASLPAKEYGRLIQQKRSNADKPASTSSRTKASDSKSKIGSRKTSSKQEAAQESAETKPSLKSEKPAPILKQRDQVSEPAPTADESGSPPPTKRTRRRSNSSHPDAETAIPSGEETAQLSLPTPEEAPETPQPSLKEAPKLKSERAKTEVDEDLTETLPPDWGDMSTLDEDYDEDDEDDEEDFEDEGDSWDDDEVDAAPHLDKLEISPLTEASLPRLCYVVVERSSSELVALPLRTFAHLGEIPEAEGESRTLPVFDNHRVARRFSRRNQRVVKLPDGSLLQTTSPYLMAKGITRLLIDGQVFALEEYGDGYEDDEADFE